MPAKYIYNPWTAPISVQKAAGKHCRLALPRTAYYSSHHSPRTTHHHAPLTTHHSPRIKHQTPRTIRHTPHHTTPHHTPHHTTPHHTPHHTTPPYLLRIACLSALSHGRASPRQAASSAQTTPNPSSTTPSRPRQTWTKWRRPTQLTRRE